MCLNEGGVFTLSYSSPSWRTVCWNINISYFVVVTFYVVNSHWLSADMISDVSVLSFFLSLTTQIALSPPAEEVIVWF